MPQSVHIRGLRPGPDFDYLARRLGCRVSDLDPEIKGVLEQALIAARPAALYRPVYISERGPDFVVLSGTRFAGRVMAVNLERAERVFAFVATSGTEVEDFGESYSTAPAREACEAAKELALLTALSALVSHIDENFRPGRMSVMNPGSIKEWPITEQRPLFDLIGDPEATLGITLFENGLMAPSRTVSGIRFPSEFDFESCMLCPREDCPRRRADYDPGLYKTRYADK